MTGLTLDQASTILDKALEKGRELNLHPLTVVVLDAGGQLKAMKREDRSSLLRPEIAMGKAWGTLGMGFGGREFARRAGANPVFLQALMAASGGVGWLAYTQMPATYTATAVYQVSSSTASEAKSLGKSGGLTIGSSRTPPDPLAVASSPAAPPPTRPFCRR